MGLNKNHLLEVLNHVFNESIMHDFNYGGMDYFDEKIIYNFFHNKTWQELVVNLDIKSAAYPLELATYYFNEKNFKYYIPLYIYASLLNEKWWVFDSCFIDRYLSPDYQEIESFLSLFDTFSNPQLNVISQYMHYAGYNIGYLSARTAFEIFWEIFYNPRINGESIFLGYKNMDTSE
ncbi:hypothetical protein [Salmonella enterica]|uniref:hypothetical protein n=1 Tax=Salmonella enterica TaxID=28901 RepID=UPI000DA3149F|nr:hypothetical protein [Salmonella enterica]EAQ6500090.1 hypothetical protein [Salmonella enterica]ECF6029110.1 hypothetical protein [Salmonella enterica subsp. salamae serovar Greenside]ECJ2543267.1 hypothetical protein [Salmonella enterica subsp. salamae]SQI54689.1 Uncharacterised protein [Salmonella enterica subsp. salamae serovar Greenside]